MIKQMTQLGYRLCLLLLAGSGALKAQQQFPVSMEGHGSTGTSAFIENKGQWPEQVLFLIRLQGMNAWITRSGAVYDLYSYSADTLVPDGIGQTEQIMHGKGQVIEVRHEGANPHPRPQGAGPYAWRHNYFLGNDPSRWATDVMIFREAWVRDIYPGIDQRWYLDNGNLRFDYIVHPGSDYSRIRLVTTGADRVLAFSDELVWQTCLGEVKQTGLLAYQWVNNEKQLVDARWYGAGDRAGFQIGHYDDGNMLIIDPLIYSTYLGGSQRDMPYSIQTDLAGNAYVTGSTASANFPTTPGAYDVTFTPNLSPENDVFVSKLDPTGSSLIFSTFIGGSANTVDNGYSLVLDASGNICVAGQTSSSDFPVTAGAYDQTFNGSADAFVLKLSSTGNALLFSGFLGSTASDMATCVGLDAAQNIYVYGQTASATFPVTAGAWDVSYNGGSSDLFVSSFNSNGSALLYSSYIGGTDLERPVPGGLGSGYDGRMAVDAAGQVYITGYTASADFPTTAGAWNTVYNGGVSDIFVAKLNSAGNNLLYSTYLGGSVGNNCVSCYPGGDYAHGIAVDASGNAYITGETWSYDFPHTPMAYDTTFNMAFRCIFVTKLNPGGTGLLFSTALGDSAQQHEANAIELDNQNNPVIIGYSTGGFPITPGAYDSLAGSHNVIIAKLSTNGNQLIYSTYLGTSNGQEGLVLSIDSSQFIYAAGTTRSAAFPTTPGAYDVTQNGGSYDDGFVTKLGICPVPFISVMPSVPVCENTPVTLQLSVTGAAYSWSDTSLTGNTPTVTPDTTTTYTVIVTDPGGCAGISTASVTVQVVQNSAGGVTVQVQPSDTICLGGQVTLNVLGGNGASGYSWSHPGLSGSSPQVTPPASTTYTVSVTNPAACWGTVTATVPVTVIAFTASVSAWPDDTLCPGETVTLTAQMNPPYSGATYQWLHGPAGAVTVADSAGLYTVIAAFGGCADTAAIPVAVLDLASQFPWAADDWDTTQQNLPVLVPVTVNDLLAGGGVNVFGSASHGSAVYTSGGILYTPDPGFSGLDSVRYLLCHPVCQAICDTAWVRIFVNAQKPLQIPEVLSPNGDGWNDLWVIENLDQYPDNTVVILNRWGDKLYSAAPYQNDWDGKGNCGMLAGNGTVPDGTYFFVLDLGAGNEIIKGFIEIAK